MNRIAKVEKLLEDWKTSAVYWREKAKGDCNSAYKIDCNRLAEEIEFKVKELEAVLE